MFNRILRVGGFYISHIIHICQYSCDKKYSTVEILFKNLCMAGGKTVERLRAGFPFPFRNLMVWATRIEFED
jgi:hypothetical protein